MSEIVNLNRFRKSRTRDEAKVQASENRVKYGRTKAEKENDRRAAERREKETAGRKLEKGEE